MRIFLLALLFALFAFFAFRMGRGDGEGASLGPAKDQKMEGETAVQSPDLNELRDAVVTSQAGEEDATEPQDSDQEGPEETDSEEPKPEGIHNLHGEVVLVDGTPLPGVRIYATPTKQAGEKRSAVTSIGTPGPTGPGSDAGKFSFPGIPNGAYRLRIIKDDDLPIVGSEEVMAGPDPLRVEVNARLVWLRAVDLAGTPVPMNSLRTTVLRDTAIEGSRRRASRVSFGTPVMQSRAVVLISHHCVFAAEGPDGKAYFAELAPDRPAGLVRLDMSEKDPAFGRLLLRMEDPELPDGAYIHLDSIKQDGSSVLLMAPAVRAVEGRVQLPLGGLLPGAYHLQVSLQGAGPIGLAQDVYDVQVDAGGEHALDLKTFVGGILEVSASTEVEHTDRMFGGLEIRTAPDGKWKELWMVTHAEGGGIITNTSAMLDGPPAVSFPIEAGHYEIRLTHEGFQTEVRAVQIVKAGNERLSLSLQSL